MRSACYFSLKNWKNALEDALLCVSKDPKFIKGYYRLSAAQTELGLFNDAEATLKAALVLEPKNEVIHRQLKSLQQKKLGTAKKPTRKLDDAQMKEIMDLQEQTNSFGRDLRAVKNRIGSCQRDQRLNSVTSSQIDPLEESVSLYRSVGKAFVFASKTEVKDRIEKENAETTKNLNDLADRHEYLERRIASNTSNLKDMTAGL
jgi:chaperonin cofactor prefoldin